MHARIHVTLCIASLMLHARRRLKPLEEIEPPRLDASYRRQSVSMSICLDKIAFGVDRKQISARLQ